MSFVSVEFLLFFVSAVCGFYALPKSWRVHFILVASYVFYASWETWYLLIIVFSTWVDYYAGLRLGRSDTQPIKRLWLIVSIVSNLTVLGIFKYFNFFVDNANVILQAIGWEAWSTQLNLMLPVGISFFTFQSMSYTLDVFCGQREPETRFITFAAYVAFFPQLVAGPIERSTNLLPQMGHSDDFDRTRVTSGLERMLWGFFKKTVIADRLAIFVDAVYADPGGQSGFVNLLALYCFAFQIYCDFSGYSDIAIGAARVLGFDLMENFNQPYLSRSFQDFWGRWHVSLSTWFRDYLYIPLGGNRYGPAAWCRNIAIVFLLSGLWHGAQWTFVVWGAIHAVFLLSERWLGRLLGGWSDSNRHWTPLQHLLQVVLVFHGVVLAWAFFRANSVAEACRIIGEILLIGTNPWWTLPDEVSYANILVGLVALIGLVLIERYRHHVFLDAGSRLPRAIRWPLYYGLMGTVALFGIFDRFEFLYFRF